MTRPDDEYPPLDVTSTLNLGALDEVLEGAGHRRGAQPGVRLAAAGHGAAGGAPRPERRRPVPARPRRDHQRPAPGQRHLPRRRDRVPPARRVPPRTAATFTVRDVGSLNGTYVNRERVEAATLSNGDEVQIGKFRLVFIAGPRLDES